MHPLVPAVLSTLCADLLLVGVFSYLYQQNGEPYLRLWGIGWSGSAIRHLMAVLELLLGPKLVIAVVMQTAEPVALLFILGGTYNFAGRRMPRAWIAGALATAAWAVHGQIRHLSLLDTRLPSFWFMGAVTVWTGVVFLRHMERSAGTRLTGACLVLWGLHLADHPFLRSVVWFAPWGFSLATVLELAVAIGIVVVYFERTRRSLEQSEHRFRALFEGALEGVYRAEAGGRLFEVNPALVRLLGYETADELCGIDPATQLFEDDTARERLETELDKAGAVRGHEVIWLRRDGDPAIVSLDVRRVEGGDGRRYDEGFVRDVTDSRRLEDRLRQAQKMEALGRVAGGVAHDFNNLLTVILGNLSLLEVRVTDEQTEGEIVKSLQDAAARAAGLTGQLLAFSRRQVLKAQVLDLCALTEGMSTILTRLIGENIDLVVRPAGTPCRVKADPVQLEQVILNLAINARDAMPDGGKLFLSTSHMAAGPELGARHPEASAGAYVVLEVKDTGRGMDERTIEHLYEPFFTTKGAGRGTGLGLATVYGIVTQTGGFIDVESEIDRGTAFRVHLPAAEGALQPASPQSSPAPAPNRGTTILLVEDEPSLRLLVERVLREAGYRVLLAGDGKEALGVARGAASGIDLLVTDIVMPQMSGPALARRLKDELGDLPVVFVSGYADQHADAGLDDDARFLPKPFTPADLLEVVQKSLPAACQARQAG